MHLAAKDDHEDPLLPPPPCAGLQVKLATLYPDCNLDHGSCEAQPAALDSDCYLDHTSREARE